MPVGRSPAIFTYLYPWDAARLGSEAIVRELVDLGVAGVDLTPNYHSIEAFSPRGETPSVFCLPQGSVVYPARASRFGRVTPRIHPDEAVTGAWLSMAEMLEKHSMLLDCWLIGLLQPWMAQQFPETARVLPTGDRTDGGICPASPDVVEFFTSIIGDLCDQFPIRRLNLEGSTFPPFDYGWARPRRLAELSESSIWLLGLCFCDHCASAAKSSGIDNEGLRRRIISLVKRDLDGGGSDPVRELLADDQELAALVEVKRSIITSFNCSLAKKATECGSGLTAFVPFERSFTDLLIADEVALALSGVRINPAVFDDVGAVRDVAVRLGTTLEVSAFVPEVGVAGTGVELDSPAVLDSVSKAASSGVDQIALYHYGLLNPKVLAALVSAAQST